MEQERKHLDKLLRGARLRDDTKLPPTGDQKLDKERGKRNKTTSGDSVNEVIRALKVDNGILAESLRVEQERSEQLARYADNLEKENLHIREGHTSKLQQLVFNNSDHAKLINIGKQLDITVNAVNKQSQILTKFFSMLSESNTLQDAGFKLQGDQESLNSPTVQVATVSSENTSEVVNDDPENKNSDL